MRKITVISLALIVFLIAGCGATHSSTDGSSAGNRVSDKEAVHDEAKDIVEDSNHEITEDAEEVNTLGSANSQDVSNVEKTNGEQARDVQDNPNSTGTQADPDNPDTTGTQVDPDNPDTTGARGDSDNQNSSDPKDNQGSIEDPTTQDTTDAQSYPATPDTTGAQSYPATPDSPESQADSDKTAKPLIINLTDIDGKGTNYTFTYNGEAFKAEYTIPENWKIHDSYLINSESDMLIICQALIDEHPIHGRDMVSFRTAEDMVYEWQIHNLAYAFLEDDDPFKDDCRDVDFDPKDQDLTIEEFYKSRTGEDFDFEKIFGAEP